MIRSTAVLFLLSSSRCCCDARLNPNLLRGEEPRTAQMTSSTGPNHAGVNNGVQENLGADIPALLVSAPKLDATAVKLDQSRFLSDNEGDVQGSGAHVVDTPIETHDSPFQDLDPFEDLPEDNVDPPSGVDETHEEAEVPEMEPIPPEYTVNQPDVVDESVPDSTLELAPGLGQDAEIPAMERIPPEREHFVFNPAESAVLNETSSVCAGSWSRRRPIVPRYRCANFRFGITK
ncbi:hypothetical protein MHU86_19793 [Fragilaria crotonensis]|nr:hypothetical protein MHU86_19793 [Fragilaria crotonensis]